MNNKKVTVAEGFEHLQQEIAQIADIFERKGQVIYEGRNKVKALTLADTSVVVKRFKHLNIIQSIVYTFFKKSKAERAFLFAAMMRKRGVLTPQEVACVEIKHKALLTDCYFISMPCYLPPLSTILRKEDFDRSIAHELGVAIARWHEAGVLHGDLNLTNILYETELNGRCRFWLIDTNRSSFDNATYLNCINNIMRLSHDRHLLQYIVTTYAETRGWEVEKTVADVMACLESFEQYKHKIGLVKKFFRIITRKKK